MMKSLLFLYTWTTRRRENKTSFPGNTRVSEVTMQLLASCSESLRMEGSSWAHPVPIAVCILSTPATHSSISYSRLELHNLPGQSVPVFNHHPQSKKAFLKFKQNYLYFSLCLLLLLLPLPCIQMKLYKQVR